jgi:dolichol-phosphate mannosyltransferase
MCFSTVYTQLERKLQNLVAYLIAFLLATEVSILVNFVLNDRITSRLYMTESITSSEHIANSPVHEVLIAPGASGPLEEQVMSIFAPSEPVSALIPDHRLSLSATQQDAILRTLIIIPTYNERENLPLLLRDIFSFAPRTDVLVVDDNSPDGTGELADQLSRQDARVHVLHRPGKLGLGTAYIAGFKYAIAQGYGAAFEMDADFSHDPRYLPDMLRAIEHADLVIGSRYVTGGATPNWSISRRMISGCGNLFARFMLGIPVHDCTGGFRCYRRHVLEEIELDSVQSRGYAFQVELTHRVLQGGFKIVEVPITFMDRRLGVSKMSRSIVIEAFAYVLRARFGKSGVSGAI